MPMSVMLPSRLAALLALLFCSCAYPPRAGEPAPRRGDEISVCGRLYHTGARVVLWNDRGGYDAYRAHRHFAPDEVAPSRAPDRVVRFGRRSTEGISNPTGITDSGWHVRSLGEVVSQVVLHFDVCGTSRRCFEVLHDIRGLSCHFLVDLDGTIYQTLDLKERAWHAAHANDRSIGIEIAHIGCYPDGHETLSRWYSETPSGVRVTIPEEMGITGLPADFRPMCARPQLFRGVIHGREYVQYDFTEEQYRALEKLLTALCRIFPKISADAPRDDSGAILDTTLPTREAMLDFRGIIAHYHLSENKVDPGPAFDWSRILDHLRRQGL